MLKKNNTDLAHDIGSYIYNITNLLKFIKEDSVINNKTTSEMLDKAISIEQEIITKMNRLSKLSKAQYE
jgi:hypothetical protein